MSRPIPIPRRTRPRRSKRTRTRKCRRSAPRRHRSRRRPKRKGGYELPSLALLTAPKRHRPPDALDRGDRGKRQGAGKRARRLRRARRDHQRASGSGRHALRARARARHQVLARDRPRRRHRALDEQGLGACRGGARPQRHRHRAAQSEAREGAAARAALGRATTPTRRRACRSASARPSAAIR